MKVSAILALAAGAADVSAHYIFQQFGVGSQKFGLWEYIRKHNNNNSPVTSLSSNDMRCNLGASSGAGTAVANVKAGDSVTFYTDQAVYHQGPLSLYLSKAPGSVQSYDGSGDWFKIYDWGPTFNGGQASWPLRSSYQATIPRCIPNGEYLVRIHSLAIHNPGSTPQWYISCAQISVSGGGNANPSPNVKIPGAFKASDPGYTANIYNNFKSYTVPGPSIFSC